MKKKLMTLIKLQGIMLLIGLIATTTAYSQSPSGVSQRSKGEILQLLYELEEDYDTLSVAYLECKILVKAGVQSLNKCKTLLIEEKEAHNITIGDYNDVSARLRQEELRRKRLYTVGGSIILTELVVIAILALL